MTIKINDNTYDLILLQSPSPYFSLEMRKGEDTLPDFDKTIYRDGDEFITYRLPVIRINGQSYGYMLHQEIDAKKIEESVSKYFDEEPKLLIELIGMYNSGELEPTYEGDIRYVRVYFTELHKESKTVGWMPVRELAAHTILYNIAEKQMWELLWNIKK